MADYDDPVEMVESIRQHVLDTGHQVTPADNPYRQFMGYVCLPCEEVGLSWHCSATSIHALSGRVPESNILRWALGNHARREQLTEYLNKVEPKPRILSRYERKWVI